MTALSANLNRNHRPGTSMVTGKNFVVKNGSTVYEGSLVGILSQGGDKGRLIPWTVVSGRYDLFLGVAQSKVVGDGSLEVLVFESGVELIAVAVTGASTLADVGEEVYATDDGTGLTLTAPQGSSSTPIGWITHFYSSTQFDVRLFTPEQYRCWAKR